MGGRSGVLDAREGRKRNAVGTTPNRLNRTIQRNQRRMERQSEWTGPRYVELLRALLIPESSHQRLFPLASFPARPSHRVENRSARMKRTAPRLGGKIPQLKSANADACAASCASISTHSPAIRCRSKTAELNAPAGAAGEAPTISRTGAGLVPLIESSRKAEDHAGEHDHKHPSDEGQRQ